MNLFTGFARGTGNDRTTDGAGQAIPLGRYPLVPTRTRYRGTTYANNMTSSTADFFALLDDVFDMAYSELLLI